MTSSHRILPTPAIQARLTPPTRWRAGTFCHTSSVANRFVRRVPGPIWGCYYDIQLNGKIIKKTLNAVVSSLLRGGVGYYAQCPASVAGASSPGVRNETTIYTVMNVTENGVSLYGFASEEQQACFLLLTSVSGVGAKVGLAILSVMEPDRVALAISAGDHKAFKAASGVGPKLAQRIVLELKDKVAKGFAAGIDLENVAGAASDTAAAQGAGQAIAALVSLGYSQSEAALAVSKIDGTLPVEEIIKLALRSMAGRR